MAIQLRIPSRTEYLNNKRFVICFPFGGPEMQTVATVEAWLVFAFEQVSAVSAVRSNGVFADSIDPRVKRSSSFEHPRLKHGKKEAYLVEGLLHSQKHPLAFEK
jgi:hypothetical protein